MGKRSQWIKRAKLRREGLLPAWVEPPPRPQTQRPLLDDQLPPGALVPHLQRILPISRRFLNAEQLADALRPRFYCDRRYPPVQEPAPQPVQPPVQTRLPDVIEEPEPEPEPIKAPLPDIVPHPRPVRVNQEHHEQAAAAAAPIEQAARAGDHEEKSEEESEKESEEEDEIQLFHLSSFEGSSDDT